MEESKTSRQVERNLCRDGCRGDHCERETNTWNRSCRESEKRESELYKMVQQADIDERQEHKERSMLKDLLQQLQKEREEQEEARGLIEEMQRSLHEAQARASETEPKLGRVLGKYIYSFEKEMERPHYIMDKMWQMMQSKDTETSNLDKHFEEIINKVQQARWNESTKTKRFWTQEEDQEQVADGKHTELCGRMGLPSGDEGAAGCLRVDVCLGKGVAVQRHSDRF